MARQGGAPVGVPQSSILLRHLPYLGFGLLWAWPVMFWNATMSLVSAGEALPAYLWLTSALSSAAALPAAALCMRDPSKSLLRNLAVAGVAFVVVGAALLAVGLLASLPPGPRAVLSIVAALSLGAGPSLLMLCWVNVYRHVEMQTMELQVLASFIVSFACYLLFPNLNASAAWIWSVLLAVASWALLMLCQRRPPETPPQAPSNTSANMRPFRIELARTTLVLFSAFLLIGFSDGYASFNLSDGLGPSEYLPIVAGRVAAIILTLLFFHFSVHLGVIGTFRWVTPAFVIGALLLLMGGSGPAIVGKSLFTMADSLLYIMMFIYYIALAQKGLARNPVACVAFAYAAMLVGIAGGSLLSSATTVAIPSGGPSQAIVFGFVLGAYVLATLVLPREDLSISRTTPEYLMYVSSSSRAVPAIVLDVDEACAAIASEYKFTKREAEVLPYLARGRSLPYIREAMHLSENTISSYKKQVYAKLNVHTKQELIDLVESYGTFIVDGEAR